MTTLNDKNGRPVKAGDKVRAVLQGCSGVYEVKKVRPRKGDFVMKDGGYLLTPDRVEKV